MFWNQNFVYLALFGTRLYHPSISLIIYQIHIQSISHSDQIYIRYIYCCTKISCSVYFLFLLPIKTFSSILFIETVSNTYQIHFHNRSKSYPLHILLYQNKLHCVFSVFTPNSLCIIYPFHVYYIKYIPSP